MTAAQRTKLLSFGTLILLMSGLGLLMNPSTPAAGADTTLPDTAPPAPVGGLVAVDERDGKVKLGWNAAIEEDFAYYAVYSSNEFFLTVAGKTAHIKLADNASTNFTVIGLSDGVQYFFAVTAVDKSGNENKSVLSVSATPTASVVPDTTAPPAVSGVSASDARDGKVNLTWAPVNITDFNHYSIYVAAQAGASVSDLNATLKIADMATGRITLTGLNDSTTYYFAVTAVDRSGNENRTVILTVSATPTATPPTTNPKKEDDEGPEAANLALYQAVTALLLVAVVALITFRVLSVARRPAEDGPESGPDGNEMEDGAPKEEGDGDGNEDE
jgi:predicted phage tail protein